MLFDPKKFKQYSPPAKEGGVVEGLKRAKVLIENGWCQKAGRIGDQVCLQTAIHDAYGWPQCGEYAYDWRPSMIESSLDVLRSRAAIHEAIECIDIVAWNDEPGRTQQQVIDAVDKAIGIARRKNL